jgi:uncharacterized damage-inducible protein DinB
MDPSDFLQLYEYLVKSRERFLAKFNQLGWRELIKDRGASWNSILGVFLHALDVEESWLHYPSTNFSGVLPLPEVSKNLENYVVYDSKGDWKIDPSLFANLQAVEQYHRVVVERTRSLLANLTKESLKQEFVLSWGYGKLRASFDHILLNAFVDEMGHLGELNCLFWQIDVDPDWVGWLDLHQVKSK